MFKLLWGILFFSSFVQADTKDVELKCWVKTVEAQSVIEFYLFNGQRFPVTLASEPEKFAESLAGKYIYKSDGITKVAIKKAEECVLVDKRFSDAAANRLFDKSPR